MSVKCHEYTPEHPWYGAGQGTGNATIQWAVLSHSLITAYKSQAHLWMLSDPTSTIRITQGINAFCDDTSLVNVTTNENPQTTVDLLPTTQTNLNLWNDLLKTSGRALNPMKCTWGHFHWHTKNDLLSLQGSTNGPLEQHLTVVRLRTQPSPFNSCNPTLPTAI